MTKDEQRIKVGKSHNLINAFAKAYDSMLFDDPAHPGSNLFGVYFNKPDVHLKTVCFNSTELNNGISFRFQTNGQDTSIHTVGNYYLHFNNAGIARQLKLGDISATSSCFPAGFEPMCYPMDYMHGELNDADTMMAAITYGNNDPLKLKDVNNKPFSMVDGGVVDNQGLYSMMMEDTYRAENPPEKPFDLMMVCDVASFYVDGYQQPVIVNSWWKNLSLNKLKIFLICCVVVFATSAIVTFCPYFSGNTISRTGFFLLLTTSLLTAFYGYLWFQLCKEKKGLSKSSWGQAIVRYSGYFAKLSFGSLQQMLAGRLNSVLEIVLDLYLNQERRQYYDTFYNMPAYQHRSLSCLIYEFSAQHDTQRKENLKDKDSAWWPGNSGCFDPSTEMQGIATRATSMATTLWFDAGKKQTMRDEIIICGQFTMCYNLLKHIYRLEVLDQKWKTDQTLQALKTRLINDWNSFLVEAGFFFKTL
jgi:hypothetical protein